MREPIIALATPPLKGALAILRLSGDGVFALTDELFSKKISGMEKRGLVYGTLSDRGEMIDEVVLLVYPAPNSMTGEDVVEISCHGSMVIVNQIIEAYLSRGARYATRGEFSSRAFLNGKLDLIEAEAINDLINATTRESKNVALMSLSGKTSELILPLRKEISDQLALLEVGIDFPEYDDEEMATAPAIAEGCARIRARLSSLIAQGEEGKLIREGVNVAIIGKPNVGKSSILNALLQQNKAIVSNIPGTTRDIVEGDLSLKGIPLHLLDTAGIRDSSDVIEQLGVERSRKSIDDADLIVLVLDASKEMDEEEESLLQMAKKKKHIVVYNKMDLVDKKEEGRIYVSAEKGDVEALKEAIYEVLGVSEDAYKVPSLSNARELALLRAIDEDLAEVQQNAMAGLTMDLLSVGLQSAYNKTRELLGEDATHDLTDEIFSRFCVGK